QSRVATPVLFGGGTLALVTNAGALTVRVEDREAFLGLISFVAPGNALVVVEQAPSGAKNPGQAKVADAIRAAGGLVRLFESPREGALANWIDSEARDRGIPLGPGAAKELASRVERLVDQARRWRAAELAAALDGLLEVEAVIKGAPGRWAGDAQHRLAFTLWIADHVGSSGMRRRPGPPAPQPAASSR